MFETAGDDPVLVDDHTTRDGSAQPLRDSTDGFIEPAGRDISIGRRQDAGFARARPFCWPSGRDPVDLADRVVINGLKTELLEPPRGPGTRVSQRIPAVDDDRSGPVEDPGGLGVELLERQVHGPGEMLFRVLGRGQHLYQLGVSIEELPNLMTVDRRWHDDSFRRWHPAEARRQTTG